MRGNRDFARMTDTRAKEMRSCVIPFDPRAFGWGALDAQAPVQAPFAAVLGCADARVPTEMIFTKGCNELFVVRVAGNVLGQECLGSLRYAVMHFPETLKLLVVLAHAKCGAVTEAVDIYLQPSRYLQIATNYPLRSIEDQILIAVRAAAITIEILYGHDALKRPGCRAALLEAAVILNAAWSAYCLRQEFRQDFPNLGVAFGAYDLLSRYVRLPMSPPGQTTDEELGLFAPPEDIDGFRELSATICRGSLIRSLLEVD
jgi:carbonic anhydrase